VKYINQHRVQDWTGEIYKSRGLVKYRNQQNQRTRWDWWNIVNQYRVQDWTGEIYKSRGLVKYRNQHRVPDWTGEIYKSRGLVKYRNQQSTRLDWWNIEIKRTSEI